MDAINSLRGIIEKYNRENVIGNLSDNHYKIATDILHAWEPDGYIITSVDWDFEDGGRWTNYESTIYKVEQADFTTAYFKLKVEVAATEMQNGDYSFWLTEVEPKEIVVIKYVPLKY